MSWTLSRRSHWTALEHIVQGPRRPWNGRCLEEYGAVWSRQGCFRAAPEARVVYRREVHHKAPHLGIVHVDEDRSCFGSERIIHVGTTCHEHCTRQKVPATVRKTTLHPTRTSSSEYCIVATSPEERTSRSHGVQLFWRGRKLLRLNARI